VGIGTSLKVFLTFYWLDHCFRSCLCHYLGTIDVKLTTLTIDFVVNVCRVGSMYLFETPSLQSILAFKFVMTIVTI